MTYFQKYFASRAIKFYFITLLAIFVLFPTKFFSLLWLVFGIVQVAGFFYFSYYFSKKWAEIPDKIFINRLFKLSLIIRLVYVVFIYFFYLLMTGIPFEFGAADSEFYHALAARLANKIRDGNIISFNIDGLELSDTGYVVLLSYFYSITGSIIILPRILFAFLSAKMAVLIYITGARNFGETAGRIAGIMAMLLPNFIYYTGLHVKETIMIYLVVLFIERADFVIRLRKFNLKNLGLVILTGLLLFTFRTALGAIAFLSFFLALIISSGRIISLKVRIFSLFMVLFFIFLVFFTRIEGEVYDNWEESSTNIERGLEWRAMREGGNKLAKYGSTMLFTPLMITAPFPTLVTASEDQRNQMLMNGGYFTRNVYSFFVLIALFTLFRKSRWRNHILITAFLGGYLIILASSTFALSERYHLPSLPFMVLFAGYGITLINRKNVKYFTTYLIFVIAVILLWNWFKLAGRGLV